MNTIFVVDFETNDGFDAADNKVIEMGHCLVKGAWAEVETGFLQWMINKPVEPDYVWNARRELQRRMDHAN